MSMRRKDMPTVEVKDIKQQAENIRGVVQSIIDACDSGQPIRPYARNTAAGGALAQDGAVLGIMIVAYELQQSE